METKTGIIKALSLGRIEEGSIGFMITEEEGKWFNVSGEKDVLLEIAKNIIAKGNKIEFEFNNGIVGNLKLIEVAPKKESGKFDDMTNFEDLLSAAHKEFKENGFDITTEMLEMNYEKKQAIFKATVIVGLGGVANTYTAHGDSEGIGSEMIKPHFIRMAETRAIARALRWATNNAKVSEEETSGEVPKRQDG